MGTPQFFSMASLPTLFIDEGVIPPPGTCAAARPTSTGLEPVLALRGFDHWFLLSYTFPPCLPDPSRLVVPTRSVVVRAASHPSLRLQGQAALSFSEPLR